LENSSHRFLKSNILDIKLGTNLHGEEAREDKQVRMSYQEGQKIDIMANQRAVDRISG
jgi:hypothetical protein